MMFITGPLYSGKRTLARNFRAASSPMCRTPLPRLRPRSSSKRWPGSWRNTILSSPPRSAAVLSRWMLGARAGREAAGRLACLLAARADCVVQMFCGIPTVLKGELPPC